MIFIDSQEERFDKLAKSSILMSSGKKQLSPCRLFGMCVAVVYD